MQPQRICEHTLARRGGNVADRPSAASPRYEDSSVRRASAAILHAPALRGSALSLVGGGPGRVRLVC